MFRLLNKQHKQRTDHRSLTIYTHLDLQHTSSSKTNKV